MNGQVPVPGPRDDGEGVSKCVPSGSLAVDANSGRPGGGVWRRDLKQVTSRQAASVLEQESRGVFPFSLAGAAPGSGSGFWVRVLGDRRPKAIGWHLARKVR